ncbi:DUF305 domain-containing protein [Nocardia panacis]|uniref:DUF305 domain-containing protein n=1 Tax=Nocardia panacis TaxID=2340916 RepID=A0A3A4K5H6_9NOCA|nr:DUF305 domain-containing protein [Nocardia panacis]RJO75851.1 DUF305 domain-containing protein [Nocardia panacis]
MFVARTRIAIVSAAVATVALTAGCGDKTESKPMSGMDHGTTSTAAARTDFNDADVTFLQMMYPHHAQAVEMAQLVPNHSQNPQLRTLAANVEAAQAPEMKQITTLLQSFGKPAPSAGGHSGHTMSGMMTPDQMTALGAATGPDFDRQWLTMMIDHHTGALTMARDELAGGVNPEARTLATNIVADQQKEIDTMRGMLR